MQNFEKIHREPGSFRDPAGYVFHQGNSVFRAVSSIGTESYAILKEHRFIKELVDGNRLVGFTCDTLPCDDESGPDDVIGTLKLNRLPFIAFPYEWPFSALKTAAVFHLDLQIDALDAGIELSDASAFNVQFNGVAPIFIDHLSFRRYNDGSLWTGHRQFCEQFLNPLLMTAKIGLPFNRYYRGTMNGIAAADIAKLLPMASKLSPKALIHIYLPLLFERRALNKKVGTINMLPNATLPKSSYRSMLQSLRQWIKELEPKGVEATHWGDYEHVNSYGEKDQEVKAAFVGEFVEKTQPKLLWDMGCNTGFYSSLALRQGAKRVIGFDTDFTALERAFKRAKQQSLAFTPLFQDLVNPSPDQGWRQRERQGLNHRTTPDAILALAILHHLVVANNIPLDDAVSSMIECAPCGVLEFVSGNDPMTKALMVGREKMFQNFTVQAFLDAVARRSRIVSRQSIQEGNRLLVWYERAH